MDIQKEKEAFLNVFQFFKSFKGIGFSDETEQFFLRKNKPNDAECLDVSNLNQMWRAWWARANAQAVPEGFVLMPIKPTETMVMAVVKEYEGDAFLPYSLYDAYVKQAMIEAQEQGQ
jgi:hypothetical protein